MMKELFRRYRKSLGLAALFLLVVSALVYLPLVSKLGYAKDDWYLMYDAHTQGPQFFQQVYQIDRPARAYVMAAAYSLFGDQALYYHLSGYLWRLLSAVAFLWTLYMVWPDQKTAAWLMSLFFLIYPGFLSQINPIDYQSQLLSLFLAMLSIALTVRAIRTSNLMERIFLTGFSMILAIAYLALVEYMIGLEALRLLWIILLVWRQNQTSWRERVKSIARKWLPFAIGALAFLVWRLFIFQNERRATDVSLQLGLLAGSPIYTGLWWMVYLIQDAFRVIFLAWTVPLYSLAFDLRLRDILLGSTISLLVVLIVWFGITFSNSPMEETEKDKPDWRTEALWVGLLSVVAGLLPVIIANRHADFADYSRYTLASSAGGVMVVIALAFFLRTTRLLTAGICLLTFSAALTHYANAANAALETAAQRNFWWQVSWRAPQIQKGTTLAANYPVGAIQEEYFVRGPADIIYYPQKSNAIPVPSPLGAAVLTDANVLQILSGKGVDNQTRRGVVVNIDYGNVLVITQATLDGCVRIIDGSQPELSSSENQRIMLVAPQSKIKFVVTDTSPASPPVTIFGPEPVHGWCYYYEKASLARQRSDWAQVAKLGDQALADGLYPGDRIEWMPFLQAYVVLGKRDPIHQLVSIINADPFTKLQACRILIATPSSDPTMQAYIHQMFCG